MIDWTGSNFLPGHCFTNLGHLELGGWTDQLLDLVHSTTTPDCTSSDWLEFFYPALKPWVHYVPVAPNASVKKIEDLLNFLRSHEDIATKIAQKVKMGGVKWVPYFAESSGYS